MAQAATARSEADILREVINTDHRMTSELARYILDLDLPEHAVERLHALAERNRCGTITDGERLEMDSYMRVGQFLSLVKSQARRALRQPPPAR